MQNSDFWMRITNLYGSQTSPVVLCKQYSVISTRKTCLYGSQPLSVVFACKTATFGAELKVSMCPSSHLWFLHTQQRILDQNFKSLWVPDLICGFCIHNSAFWTRISSLYGSQTSSVVLSIPNCELNTRIKRLYWFQPSPVAFACKTARFGPE